MRRIALLLLLLSLFQPAQRAQNDPPNIVIAYDIGTPQLQDIWVDISSGNDSNSGESRERALRTLAAAWSKIPRDTVLTATGYRILLASGSYPAETIPVFFESRYGTYQNPVIIQAADGRGSVTLSAYLNIFDCKYIYLIDLTIRTEPRGDTLHFEQCDHVLVRGVTLDGGEFKPGVEAVASDNFKVNQCSHVYVEECEVHGAHDNAIDFVAVQYGHIVRNRIYNAQDWCIYLKGGSAYFLVESNEIYDGGTGGFTAGQGTGFQFMVSPWLHYEAYDIRFVNNIVHDTEGAGMGVNGGYNILMAYNTLYRTGTRSHLFEAVYGGRSCDGRPGDAGRERCQQYLQAGGWGTTAVDDGTNYVRIPNRNVYVYNNVFYNPAEIRSGFQHFSIHGPFTGPSQVGSGVPVPAVTDQNLQIRGNIVFNGPADYPLGIEDADQGCQPSNPTCNATQLRADNRINTIEPQLVAPQDGNFNPLEGGNLFLIGSLPIPDFPGSDRPRPPESPAASLSNEVQRDFNGAPRLPGSPAGALIGGRVQGFTLSLSPTSLELQPGRSDDVKIEVKSVGGFNAPVELAVALLPNDPNLSLNLSSSTVTPGASALLTVRASESITARVFRVTVEARAENGLSQRATLSVTVTAGPSITGVTFDGKKTLTITGVRFGSSPRVLINSRDQSAKIKAASDTSIRVQGKAKKLGIVSGENTAQVVDASGTASTPFIFRN